MVLHNFDAAYLHDLRSKVVDLTFGRSSIVMMPRRLQVEHLTASLLTLSVKYELSERLSILNFIFLENPKWYFIFLCFHIWNEDLLLMFPVNA